MQDTGFKISKVLEYEEVSSTSDLCFELIEKGETEGIAVIALSQTKGRGRRGHVWVSPENAGLYLSFIMAVPKKYPSQLIPLALALSVLRCVKRKTPGASIKWPNDVLVKGKKIAGCLAEAKKGYIVAGVGVNLNNTPDSFPDPIGKTATSLKIETGSTENRKEFSGLLLSELESVFGELEKTGAKVFLKELKENCSTLGAQTKYSGADGLSKGVARDIDRLGGLIIERVDGKIEVIYCGEEANGGQRP